MCAIGINKLQIDISILSAILLVLNYFATIVVTNQIVVL